MAARAAVLLDMVLRRAALTMGRAADRSLSRRAAAMAATLVLGLVTDLRRVTRWFALRAPVSSEWELVRAWGCLEGRPDEGEALDIGERCCVNGLEDCCISLDEAIAGNCIIIGTGIRLDNKPDDRELDKVKSV